MKYSYELKEECTQLYGQGKWLDTPDGTKEENLHASIRKWFRLEELHGSEVLNHGNNIRWTPDEKLEIVSKVLAGNPMKVAVIGDGINEGQLYSWFSKYKRDGYNGFVNRKRGRKSKDTAMKKKNIHKPRELNESEGEEFIRLRAENEHMKAESEIIEKEIALREECYVA